MANVTEHFDGGQSFNKQLAQNGSQLLEVINNAECIIIAC